MDNKRTWTGDGKLSGHGKNAADLQGLRSEKALAEYSCR